MPISTLGRLCDGRLSQTGETHQQALTALRELKSGQAPIPDAASRDQAYLESCFLERLGRCTKDRWRYYMLPFAVTSVIPYPDEIVIRIPPGYLPDLLREVMPGWAAEYDDRDTPEVCGIPGLRARHERGRIILARLGFPARIVIPASRDLWRKAVLVTADLNGGPGQVRMPWLTSPRHWHPVETRFAEAWPDAFSVDGQDYANSLFASQVLRRLPGLCPLPRAVFYDLWVNRHGDTCAIQFEWENGPSHAAVLDRLLDPQFGPGAEIELFDGQTTADCYSETASRVRVRSVRQHGSTIDLRRLTSANTDMNPLARQFGYERRVRRAAVEQKYGYPASRRPQAHPGANW